MALTDGLVAYWTFDSDATDSVGSNDGSVSGATNTTGKINNGYDFNGSSDIITVTGSVDTSTTGSLSFWIKLDVVELSFPIASANTSVTNTYWGVRVDATGTVGIQQRNSGDTVNTVQSTNALSTSWAHVVITSSGTAYKIYLNGSEETLQVSGTNDGDWLGDTSSRSSFVFGALVRTSAALHLDGMLDEIGLWNREISSSEVTELYNLGDGLQYPFGSSGWTGTINGVTNPTSVNGVNVANISMVNGV